MTVIERIFDSGSSIVATSAVTTSSPRIALGRFSGAAIMVAASNGGTQVGWYASNGTTDTPIQIYADGFAVTSALTTGGHPLPDACFAFSYVAPIMVGTTACTMVVHVKG